MNKPNSKSKKIQTSTALEPKAMPVSAPQKIQDIPPRKSAASATPSHEDIARRAHEIYVQRGCPQGQSEQIWHQAEQDVRDRTLAAFLTR
jgi:hypothetical protein